MADLADPQRPRKCKSWLDTYLTYTERQESPETFHLWVAIATITAALGRAVNLPRGFYKIHPQLYLVLVAGSARCRKSTALQIGQDVLEGVYPSIEVLAQKITPEALIGRMKVCLGTRDSSFEKEASVLAFAPELETLLTADAYHNGLLGLLTRLYDSWQGTFKYETRYKGLEVIESPCLNIQGAITESELKTIIPAPAIGGGFTSRIVFVYKQTTERILLLRPAYNEKEILLKADLIYDLNTIRGLKGSFHLTDEAWEYAEILYQEGRSIAAEPTLDGYYGRRHDLTFKLAMIISASERSDLTITKIDLFRAHASLDQIEGELPKLMSLITGTKSGDDLGYVLQVLGRAPNGTLDHSTLLRRVCKKLNADELRPIIATMEQNGMISTMISGERQKVIYTLNKEK